MATGEQELLRRYVDQGDAEAFRALVEAHQGMVYAVCQRLLRNAADAEDATQNCFFEFARSAGRLHAPIAGWLHKVAVRTSIDAYREEAARAKREAYAARERESDELHPPDSVPSWDEIKPVLDEALCDLSEDERLPIILYYLEGRTHEQVAANLGVSRFTVRRRLAKGLDALRDRLRQSGILVPGVALASLLAVNAVSTAPVALTAAVGKLALAGLTAGAESAHAPTIGGMTVAKAAGISAVAAVALIAIGVFVYKGVSADTPSVQPAPVVSPVQKPVVPVVVLEELYEPAVELAPSAAATEPQKVRVETVARAVEGRRCSVEIARVHVVGSGTAAFHFLGACKHLPALPMDAAVAQGAKEAGVERVEKVASQTTEMAEGETAVFVIEDEMARREITVSLDAGKPEHGGVGSPTIWYGRYASAVANKLRDGSERSTSQHGNLVCRSGIPAYLGGQMHGLRTDSSEPDALVGEDSWATLVQVTPIPLGSADKAAGR
jgi:RNA polymerase sigma factor (sigma-70 family)